MIERASTWGRLQVHCGQVRLGPEEKGARGHLVTWFNQAYLSLTSKRVTSSKPGTSKPKSRRAAKTKGTTQPKWAEAKPGHEHEKCVSRKRGKERHRVR
jgi:hypothetical protein